MYQTMRSIRSELRESRSRRLAHRIISVLRSSSTYYQGGWRPVISRTLGLLGLLLCSWDAKSGGRELEGFRYVDNLRACLVGTMSCRHDLLGAVDAKRVRAA